jgi:hypothetical protein
MYPTGEHGMDDTTIDKVFTLVARTTGKLLASYVFEGKEDYEDWLVNRFLLLNECYGALEVELGALPGLKVGDRCHVVGEGDDIFTIESLFTVGDHRFCFSLDSGWAEGVAKCYRPNSI